MKIKSFQPFYFAQGENDVSIVVHFSIILGEITTSVFSVLMACVRAVGSVTVSFRREPSVLSIHDARHPHSGDLACIESGIAKYRDHSCAASHNSIAQSPSVADVKYSAADHREHCRYAYVVWAGMTALKKPTCFMCFDRCKSLSWLKASRCNVGTRTAPVSRRRLLGLLVQPLRLKLEPNLSAVEYMTDAKVGMI